MSFHLDQTAYTFFEVSPSASAYEIGEAYRRKVRRYPANRVWDTPMGSAAKTGLQEVERWYALISTPEARAAYDETLAGKSCREADGDVDRSDGDNSAHKDDVDKTKDSNSNDLDVNSSTIVAINDTINDTNNGDATRPTIQDLLVATGNPYLYGTLARTILGLSILWLGIFIIVYGTPSTWHVVRWPQVRAAYHRAVLAHHPDKPGGDASAMAQINRAYESLRDPYQRCLHERAQWLCAHLRRRSEAEADVVLPVTTADVTAGSLRTPPSGQVAVLASLHTLWQRAWNAIARLLERLAGC
ncbi:hypothetical protein SPBR_01898 [Sporothrix brasiliensis 5110]|uniref:J domain-containing protein n=1 Tax=Sporothrix brasiliensis 5110 TaxID=1398154 RepID=A0A0C2IPR4_9PEZI|nr:uncharacterized protein SPBR_01898 [Sporothrix brasiliensis 5110]KIH91021.1 hypothetical protein SPBR_01898 [Sporothrix brasiliensis 5110]